MSQLLLFLPSNEVKLAASPIGLISGREYQVDFMIWMNTAAQVQVTMMTEADALIGSIVQKYIPAQTWTKYKFTFTSTVTDSAAQMVVRIPVDPNTMRFDDVHVIDLTDETKQYRVMRIQGSLKPGGFIQTLTLREKTAAETA